MNSQFYKQPSDLKVAQVYVRERLQNDQCIIFVAYQDATAGGFKLLYRHWSAVALGHVWLHFDLITTPQARRKGVGGALMEAATEIAWAEGAQRIWLRTAGDNHTAQALYEKFGMVRDVQFYRYGLVF